MFSCIGSIASLIRHDNHPCWSYVRSYVLLKPSVCIGVSVLFPSFTVIAVHRNFSFKSHVQRTAFRTRLKVLWWRIYKQTQPTNQPTNQPNKQKQAVLSTQNPIKLCCFLKPCVTFPFFAPLPGTILVKQTKVEPKRVQDANGWVLTSDKWMELYLRRASLSLSLSSFSRCLFPI